ncbi:hypothetical protein OAP99_02665 [Flavobacteriaceae bacterium]|nr:hypothetical protein [Flavobacteriaceae bacterium]
MKKYQVPSLRKAILPPKLPVVVLKNGAKKDAQMLATFITHPLFEVGVETHEDINSWFKRYVDKSATEKVVCQYFVLLAYNELDRVKQRKRKRKYRVFDWMGAARMQGWNARLEAIIELVD